MKQKYNALVTPMNKGTPATLDDAIIDGITIGPLSQASYRMRIVLRDFLAQKFAKSLLECDNAIEEAMLEDLWFAITGEKSFKPK